MSLVHSQHIMLNPLEVTMAIRSINTLSGAFSSFITDNGSAISEGIKGVTRLPNSFANWIDVQVDSAKQSLPIEIAEQTLDLFTSVKKSGLVPEGTTVEDYAKKLATFWDKEQPQQQNEVKETA